MADNLFISSNVMSTIISSIIIDEKHKEDNNILVVVTNQIDAKFLDLMKDVANQFDCFSQILFFNDFSETMKLNTTVTLKQAKSFNFKKFESLTGIKEYNNIYSTLYYVQARTLLLHYDRAQVHFMENGTASYLLQDIAPQIKNRVKNLYSLNYFDVYIPDTIQQIPNSTNIVLDKNKVKEKFLQLKTKLTIKKEESAVIFCAHNFSLNKKMIGIEEEFDNYFKVIKPLTDKGYTVYFKDHPKTPNWFYNQLKTKIRTGKLKHIKTHYPVELLFNELQPEAVVSVFSSSLLTASYIFDIPSYTMNFSSNFRINNPFTMAYSEILSYFPNVDKIGEDFSLTSTKKSYEQPLYNVIKFDCTKKFVTRKQFNNIQKNIQSADFEKDYYKFFGIKSELFEIYKHGSYWNLLQYYVEPYSVNIKQTYQKLSKPEFVKLAIKTFLSMY